MNGFVIAGRGTLGFEGSLFPIHLFFMCRCNTIGEEYIVKKNIRKK